MNRITILAIASLLLVSAHAATVASPANDFARFQISTQPHRGPVYAQKHGLATPRPSVHKQSQSALAPRGGLATPPTNVGLFTATALSAGGSNYYGGVVGDYNHDGRMDLATVVSSNFGATYSLSILLNQGNGTFAVAGPTSIPFAGTDRLCAGDLNKDGFDDVVVVHTGSVDVLINNGIGSFAAPVNYPDGIGSPVAAFLGNVNGDGSIDLIVTDGMSQPNLTAPRVSTLLGNGDGTLQAATLAAFPGQVMSAVFADVNGDNRLDIISTSEVFLAGASGGYLSGTALVAANGQPNSCEANDGAIVVANLNNDAFPDIVTADCENNTVTVFLNNGGGTFLTGTSYFAGHYPQGISVANVDGGSAADVVSANSDSADITVLLGNGDGTFQPPSFGYSVGGNAWAQPAVADFDGDGKADLVVANDVEGFSFTLMLLHGFGDGSFAAARDFYSPLPPPGESDYAAGIASADFNGDGRPDFVVGNAASSSAGVTVFVANADGTLQSGLNYGGSANLNSVATGDFNGDSKQDIVASDALTGEVDLFLGKGDGTFKNPQVVSAVAGPAGRVVVGNFNGDGKPDVAVAGWMGTVAVLLNNGSGVLLAPATYSVTGGGFEMTATDLNGDGNLDLLIPNQSGSTLSILLGAGNGTFTAIADANLGYSYVGSIAAGDFNHDGKKDIAMTVMNFTGNSGIEVALGNGNGTFQTATLYPSTTQSSGLNPFTTGVQLADLNLDGNLDLVYDNSFFGTVGVMFGDGSGAMSSPVEFPAAGLPYELVTVDVNGDGALDVVTADHNSPGVVVMLNAGGNANNLASSLNPAASGQSVTFTTTLSATVRGISGVPTGSVNFMEGATNLGTGTLSGGQASLSLSNLSVGSHIITANYSGDASFVPGVSLGVTQVVTAGGGAAPDYSLGASPTSATIHPGESANFAITVTPTNGYNGTVNFACGDVPVGVSCQFSTASVTPTNGPVQLTLTVTASSTVASVAQTEHRSGRSLPLWASAMTGLFGFVLVEGLSSRRRRLVMAAVASLALLAMLSLVGCGGASAPPPPPSQYLSPSNTVQVLATGTGTGNATAVHELDLTVTVQQR